MDTLQKTKRDSSNSYNCSTWHPPSSSLHMLHHFHHPGKDSKVDGGYTMFYTELPIYYGTKELVTSSQFRLLDDKKQAIDTLVASMN